MKTDGSTFLNQRLWAVMIGGLFIFPVFILIDNPQQGIWITLVLGIIIFLVIICGLSIPVLLLIATMVSDLYLADIEIGPVSLRVYLVLLLFIFVFTENLISGKSIFRTYVALRLIVIYSLFAFWAAINNYYNSESIGTVFYNFSSTFLLGILYFLATQAILRNSRDIKIVAGFFTAVVLFSGIVGIMQWFDVTLFWDLAFKLHPGEEAIRHVKNAYDLKAGRPTGMAISMHIHTYHLITFGGFIFSWTLYNFKNKKPFSLISGCLGVIVFLAALLLTESRAALGGVFISIFFLTIHEIKNSKIFSLPLFLVPVITLTLFTIIYLQFEKNLERSRFSENTQQFERIFDLEDEKRKILLFTAISFARQNIIMGGGSNEYRNFLIRTNEGFGVSPTDPHNLFLNAMVFYGLPGLILLLFILRAVYLTCIEAIYLPTKDNNYRWIIQGAIIGLIGYCFQSFFQSDSFVVGGTLPWWLLGILCAMIAQLKENNSEGKSFPEKGFSS